MERIKKVIAHLNKNTLGYISILIVVVWAMTPFVMRCLIGPDDYAKLGQAGDMFGAVNALFSGLTIAGLIITILRQREEIKDAAKKSIEQKEQIQRHHDEQKEQSRTIFDEQKKQIQNNFDEEKKQLRKQIQLQNLERFENAFYSLLNSHQQILNQIGLTKFKDTNTQLIHSNLGRHDHLANLRVQYEGSLKVMIQNEYQNYISTFETIVNFIMRRKILTSSKERYLKIYFSTISNHEKAILLYYYNLRHEPKLNGWDFYKGWLFHGFTINQLGNVKHSILFDPIIT